MGCCCGYLDDKYREQKWTGVPCYLEDLNAIHLLEKKVLTTHELRELYTEELEYVVQRHGASRNLIFASAALKGDALIRTMDLWEPE